MTNTFTNSWHDWFTFAPLSETESGDNATTVSDIIHYYASPTHSPSNTLWDKVGGGLKEIQALNSAEKKSIPISGNYLKWSFLSINEQIRALIGVFLEDLDSHIDNLNINVYLKFKYKNRSDQSLFNYCGMNLGDGFEFALFYNDNIQCAPRIGSGGTADWSKAVNLNNFITSHGDDTYSFHISADFHGSKYLEDAIPYQIINNYTGERLVVFEDQWLDWSGVGFEHYIGPSHPNYTKFLFYYALIMVMNEGDDWVTTSNMEIIDVSINFSFDNPIPWDLDKLEELDKVIDSMSDDNEMMRLNTLNARSSNNSIFKLNSTYLNKIFRN